MTQINHIATPPIDVEPLAIRSDCSADGALVADGRFVVISDGSLVEGAGDTVPTKEASSEGALQGPAYSPTQGARQFGPVQPAGQTQNPVLQIPSC